ncbi:phospholipid scramblase-related protein [Streptomyces sp. NPDC049881]|uniref:phospholipid scramblase-related protein n=1 Tax=unclassified Streptomyces TaxID=2593676 RepID=UPI0034237657
MTGQPTTPAGWYADPQGTPNQLRWWDGSQWTSHTHAGGAAPASAPSAQPQQPSQPPQPQAQPQPQGDPGYGQPQIPQQGQYGAGAAPAGVSGGSLFTEPVLVVNQKTKLIELTNEYSVFDQHGRTIGTVTQVGQSTLRKAARFLTSLDQYMTHRLEIRDAHGQPQLMLTRPAKFIKSRVIVARPDGQQVGEIIQQNAIGKINFSIEANGQRLGTLQAENWRAWNFSVTDHTGTEVARITKTWEGLAKTMFTTADNYVLQIHRQLPDPLLSLVVATALTVDTALKQDARGLG